MAVFPVIVSSAAVFTSALKVMEGYRLSFWDSLWATAKENRCSLIISEDFQDGFILDGI